MSLQSVRHWQWIVISLVLGGGIGYLRTQAAGDLAGRFGESLNSQYRFEHALLDSEQGRRAFTDLSVHRWSKRGYVVAGSYFNGHHEQHDGKLEAIWRPTFFLAETPYKPTIDLGALGHPELAQRYRAISDPTVMDFLSLLSESNGVAYTHAWWLEMGLGSWLLCSFLLIGVVMPCCINLVAYGSLRRPPEEKGIDLSKVKTSAPPAPPKVADADLAEVVAMGDAIAAELAEGATPAPAPVTPPPPAPVKTLTTETLSPAALAARAEAEYRSKQGDFYPTARPAAPGAAARPAKRQ